MKAGMLTLFPPQLSLFFDLLLCMAQAVTEEAFVAGRRTGTGGGNAQSSGTVRSARTVLWKTLRTVPLTMGEAPVACLVVMGWLRWEEGRIWNPCSGKRLSGREACLPGRAKVSLAWRP